MNDRNAIIEKAPNNAENINAFCPHAVRGHGASVVLNRDRLIIFFKFDENLLENRDIFDDENDFDKFEGFDNEEAGEF